MLRQYMNTSQSADVDVTRRDFIRGGSFATIASMLGGVPLFARADETKDAPTEYGKEPAFQVKCAVIGTGGWGREILIELSKMPEAEVLAICDTYEPLLNRAGRSAPKAAKVADYRQVLENKDVQAVFIATPTHQHKEMALAALQAGKHVYCEAPLAHTVEDARAIAQAAHTHPKLYFQPGLQLRSDPQRLFLLPFIRSNAVGSFVMARAQWHKKTSWRFTSAVPEREEEINWRLRRETSPGLIGEIGIHQLDEVAWFLQGVPQAANGFGGVMHWSDGRDVPDTVQAVIEFPRKVNFTYDATLTNSFDAQYQIYYGTDAAVMIREDKAWLFKEVDSALLGWEVYARKDVFYKETGIALVANASKVSGASQGGAGGAPPVDSPLKHALKAFLTNANLIGTGVEDFAALFGGDDADELSKHLGSLKLSPAANYRDGLAATVMALKVNEAILKNQRIEFDPAWFRI